MRQLLVCLLFTFGCIGYDLPGRDAGTDAVDAVAVDRGDAVEASTMFASAQWTVTTATGTLDALPRRLGLTVSTTLDPCPPRLVVVQGALSSTLRSALVRGAVIDPTTRGLVAVTSTCTERGMLLMTEAPLAPATALTLSDGNHDVALRVAAPGEGEPLLSPLVTQRVGRIDVAIDRRSVAASLRTDRVAVKCGTATLPFSLVADRWTEGGTVRGLAVMVTSEAGCAATEAVDLVFEAGAVTAENGRINLAQTFRLEPRREGAAGFATTPPCATSERAIAPFCVEADATTVTLRGSATGAARLRVARGGEALRSEVMAVEGLFRVVLPRREWAMGERLEGLHLTLFSSMPTVAPTRSIASLVLPPSGPALTITEVVARPRSGQRQEFVEVMNRGEEMASLDGLSLDLGASRRTLPMGARLAPGQRAVVVGAEFDARGDAASGDPGVASGAVVVRLASALSLRDGGARVSLLSASGARVSVMPGDAAALVPRAGVGVTRQGWDMDEDDPAAWGDDLEGTATPGR